MNLMTAQMLTILLMEDLLIAIPALVQVANMYVCSKMQAHHVKMLSLHVHMLGNHANKVFLLIHLGHVNLNHVQTLLTATLPSTATEESVTLASHLILSTPT